MVNAHELKKQFLYIARANITHRDGLDNLLHALECSDFFTAPASTKFHDAFEGGLCYHSIETFLELTSDQGLIERYDMQTLTIISLFHDLCKIGYYTTDYKNQKVYKPNGSKKDEKGRFDWETVPYYTVDDQLPYGHGEKSVMMIEEYLKLTLDEKMAIRWHMGGFESKENYNYLTKAMEKFPLVIELHTADLKASYFRGKRN